MNKLSTIASQLKAVKEKGRFVTFKSNTSLSDKSKTSQVVVERMVKAKDGSVKIEGLYGDSVWFKSAEDLLSAVDWDFMRAALEMSSVRD